MAQKNSDTPSIALFVCVILLLIVLFAYFFKLRNASIHVKQRMKMRVPDQSQVNIKHKNPADVEATQRIVKAMYIPQEVGERTTTERVFLTNKGLRTMTIDTRGHPMPTLKDS